MPIWLQYGLAIVMLVLVAPGLIWIAKRYGGAFRGNLALGAILLGFGEVVDPPSKHLIEAGSPEEKESPTPGDPPTVG